jgi:hypothetical protein
MKIVIGRVLTGTRPLFYFYGEKPRRADPPLPLPCVTA